MSDKYRVELPGGGGGLTLQSAEEVDRWSTLGTAYLAQYDLRKINDLTNLATLLVQHINLYRAQQAVSGRVPQLDEDDLPTGRYVSKVLKPAEIRAYQDQINTASKEIREIERTMGIDKKAQPLDAKVLTPRGWRRMAEVSVGDYVIGSDGHPTRVTGVQEHPVGEVWSVRFTDGSTVECDIDHLWEVACDSHSAGSERVLSLEEIQATMRPGKHLGGTRRPWRVARAPVVHFDAQADALPIDPYLLGLLLGDGGLTRPGTVTWHAPERELWDAMCEVLPPELELAGPVGRARVKRRVRGGRNSLIVALEVLGLKGCGSHEKFIPELYLLAHPADRLRLLAGLVDTDGHVSLRGGGVCYATVSDQLADDIQFLVRSLGLRCGRSPMKAGRLTSFGPAGPASYLTFRLPPETPVRQRQRQGAARASRYNRERLSIVGADFVGHRPVKCISVAARDGLYVTDCFALTHNSREAAGDESLKSWLLAMKERAHRYGLHVAARTTSYEQFAMELRWRVRLNEVGDGEDKHYEDCTADGIVRWAREQLAELARRDSEFAKEEGALVLGRAAN